MKLFNADITKIAVENPMSSKVFEMPPYTQEIQPYQFGHQVTKKTRLWLKNLPLLKPTNIVDKGEFITYRSGKRMPKWYAEKWGKGGERSKTFPGIAKAMAEQWAGRCGE